MILFLQSIYQLVFRTTLSCWSYEGMGPQLRELNLFLLSNNHGDKVTKDQFTNYKKITWYFSHLVLFFFNVYFERDRGRGGAERQRNRETEDLKHAQHHQHKPDTWLELTSHEIVT